MLFLRNLRLGLRLLRRNPSFAASAIAVMALGIGATTAVFSVVKGVLLTPLPYRDPGGVVLFRADVPGYVHQAALNREEFYAIGDRLDLFDSIAVINESPGSLTSPDHMEASNVGVGQRQLPGDARRFTCPRPLCCLAQGRGCEVTSTPSPSATSSGSGVFRDIPGSSDARLRSTTCRCGWWGCCRDRSTCISVSRRQSRHALISGTRGRCRTTPDDPFRGRIVIVRLAGGGRRSGTDSGRQ